MGPEKGISWEDEFFKVHFQLLYDGWNEFVLESSDLSLI